MSDEPDIDVVVTHYDDPRRLAWVLDALAAQTYPSDRLNIVVADDGSPQLPDVSGREGVDVVTQPDEGFRAAAARNLGAALGDAPYVLFLDGDTVPEPGYCRAMVAALQEAEGAGGRCGAVVTGRRRHADFTGLSDVDVAHWCAEPIARQENRMIDEPRWLYEGHERTNNLREAGSADWRYVISAVMGMSRASFERIGGFDAGIVGYGGEDWDLAYRAWNDGVALRHAPMAVAWHDGPDAAARDDFAALKEREQMALAPRIPQPSVRGRGGIWAVPRVAITWNAGVLSPSAEYAMLESWLGLGDVGVWRDGEWASALAGDPRVQAGCVPRDVEARAEIAVELAAPCVLNDPSALLDDITRGPITTTSLTAGLRRDRRRSVPARSAVEGLAVDLDASIVDLESHGRRRWA